ncbi:MAG: protein kinase [Gemmatimonadota bacterium]
MSNIPADLRQALEGQYRIDRELGGGGMSRVFVAEELALGRLVVIKLLPPELAAAVSAERFRREIQLVARLQHPHIVPVLSAGTANGLLFYTMPFIDGRSLRDRVERETRLPVGDAITVIGEVAGALGYAHSQGLVHRDIKPENVLLSQGHALVTDFGIAKALTHGPTDAPTGASGGLTGMGMSIGTPAYMSPEQGVADPSTDHRADIYSLGIMAYELLTGATPFAGRGTTHALLMAHMVEAPPPLQEQRPELPDGLSALVTRCLAKKPEDRPQSGEDVVRELRSLGDRSGTTSGARQHTPRANGVAGAVPGGNAGARSDAALTPSGKRASVMWGSLGVLALIAIAAGAWGWRTFVSPNAGPAASSAAADSASGPTADRVTVTTFRNETGDASLDALGRMTADWVTTALAGTGLVKVLDARAALGSSSATADAGSAIKTARELGAGTIVTGSYYKLGDTLQFDVKLIDVASSEIVGTLESVKGPLSDPSGTIDKVRQRTLGALATRFNPQLAPLAQSMSRPPSFDAYQQIVAGMDAFFAGQLPEARTRFVRASQLDTASVQPRTWLLEVLEQGGDLPAADSVARELEARRERLSPLEAAQLDEYATSIRGNPAGNLAATMRMHALTPSGQWRATLARKLMIAGRWQEALDTLGARSAEIGLFKNKPYPLEQRRQLLHRLGRHEEELETAREIITRFGDSPRLRFDYARTLAALGRTDSLRPIAERVAPTVGSSWRTLLRALADELRWHGHAPQADGLLNGMLASYDGMPADSVRLPAVLRGRAEVLARLGRWKETGDLVLPTLAGDTTLATRLAVAVLTAHLGDAAAAQRVDAELAAMPLPPYRAGEQIFQRARLAMARGDIAGTIAHLRAAQTKGLSMYEVVHGNHEFIALRGNPALDALFRQ